MINYYVKKIQWRELTIDDVPKLWKTKVEVALNTTE